jgi:hypothetical protein
MGILADTFLEENKVLDIAKLSYQISIYRQQFAGINHINLPGM